MNNQYLNIEFDVCDGLATLTLNRPNKLNSFTVAMHEEVRTALQETHNNQEIRALLITAKGRGFCAGQDLNDRKSSNTTNNPPDLYASLNDYYNPLIRSICNLSKPVVCAVNGVAAGAGANIALACDIVVAAESASFIQSFNKLGLIPDSGGSWMLPRLVGHARAMALTLLGTKVSALDAKEMGMIWQVVPDSDLATTAAKLARELAQSATFGLGLSKHALQSSYTNTLDEQLDIERDLQAKASKTYDYSEGVKAFSEKRPAIFKGQ